MYYQHGIEGNFLKHIKDCHLKKKLQQTAYFGGEMVKESPEIKKAIRILDVHRSFHNALGVQGRTINNVIINENKMIGKEESKLCEFKIRKKPTTKLLEVVNLAVTKNKNTDTIPSIDYASKKQIKLSLRDMIMFTISQITSHSQ